MIQINLATAIKINRAKKDFFFYNLDSENKVVDFKLTNDYSRYKKHYQNFRVLSTLNKTEYITIK